MRALRAAVLSTPDHLLTQADVGISGGVDGARSLQLGPGENLKTTQTMLVQVFDRIDQIAVEGHARRLRDLNRGEETSDRAPVRERPSLRWCHPIRVI